MSPKNKMTRDEDHDFYSRPENQEPQVRRDGVVHG